VKIAAPHRAAMRRRVRLCQNGIHQSDDGTCRQGLHNRVMREFGPISDVVPEFPLAAAHWPVRTKRKPPRRSRAFFTIWAGQAASLRPRAIWPQNLTRDGQAEAQDSLRLLAVLSEIEANQNTHEGNA